MRHGVKKRHFNRDTNHRKALLMNLVRSLMEFGEITTTKAKAKEVKRLGDKLIYKASKPDLNSRRTLHRFFGKRDVVNTMVDSIAPAMSDRQSGYTTISTLGKRRGDNTEMAKVSLVVKPEVVGTLKNTKKTTDKKAEKKAAPKKVAPKKAAPKKKTAAKKEASKKK